MTKGITYNGLAVCLTLENPFQKQDHHVQEIKGVKVLIQNLPLAVPNVEIELMLHQLHVKPLETITYEYERDDDKKLTKIKNGTRSFLMDREQLAQEPLPRFAHCGNWRCRIFYKDQPNVEKLCYRCYEKGHIISQCRNERACRACQKPGHEEGSEFCPFYGPNDSLVFKGENDLLSNFYMCSVEWKGEKYKSAEHVYQAEKARLNGRPEVSEEIKGAKSALEAKHLCKKVYTSRQWEESNEELMYNILLAKASQIPEVKELLCKSEGQIIAECVPNQQHWSCGLTKEAAVQTDPEKWPGKNVLGRMWITVRNKIGVDENNQRNKESVKRKERESAGESGLSTRVRLNGTTPEKDNDTRTKIPSPVETKCGGKQHASKAASTKLLKINSTQKFSKKNNE